MLQRLPVYLNYLKSLPKDGAIHISATTIAQELRLNDVQVRKDLANVSDHGRPKIGYNVYELIKDLEYFLGYNDVETAVLVGAGNLGRALLSYEGFTEYGMNIIAAFDIDENIIGTAISGKQVLSMEKLGSVCSRMKIKIGIIAVGSKEAQSTCDMLVRYGVLAIWNFAPVHLHVPEQVMVKNESLSCSLAILTNHLVEKMSVV
jgi:redox-sensing transcriptional repressor